MKFTRDKLILMAAHMALNRAVDFMLMHEELGPEDIAEVLDIATKMNADLMEKYSHEPGHA